MGFKPKGFSGIKKGPEGEVLVFRHGKAKVPGCNLVITLAEYKEVMADEITEGRDLFKSRVTPELFAEGIFDRALVDVLVKSKGHVKSKIW